MKPETAKRLDKLIFQQRLKMAGLALAIGLAILAFMLFMGYEEEAHVDKVTARSTLTGIITTALRTHGRRGGYKLRIDLNNGPSITTFSPLSTGLPYRGEQVVLQEVSHKSGRKTYIVKKLNDNR